jgi:DNA primase
MGLCGARAATGAIKCSWPCSELIEVVFPAVALMGCLLSEAQEELLAVKFERIVVMFDGDEPGQQGTADCLTRLGRRMWVRAAVLPKGRQPDQLSSEGDRAAGKL